MDDSIAFTPADLRLIESVREADYMAKRETRIKQYMSNIIACLKAVPLGSYYCNWSVSKSTKKDVTTQVYIVTPLDSTTNEDVREVARRFAELGFHTSYQDDQRERNAYFFLWTPPAE